MYIYMYIYVIYIYIMYIRVSPRTFGKMMFSDNLKSLKMSNSVLLYTREVLQNKLIAIKDC